jgi:hypothetical protein
MKDIQILWAACKYHWRIFAKLFKSEGLIMDNQGNYYTDGNYQRVLSWRAFRSWQNKRIKRGLAGNDFEHFEAETNITNIKRK